MAAVIRSAARSEYLNVQEPFGPAAIAAVPSGPIAAISAVIADRLLRRAAARLPLRVVYPGGKVIGFGEFVSEAAS